MSSRTIKREPPITAARKENLVDRALLGARQLDRRDRPGARQTEITQCYRRQIRPQNAQFLEFLVGASLHQQRNEVAHPAVPKLLISVLHYGRNMIGGKSCVFLGESSLHFVNHRPLFLRHPDIVAAN